jgi:hypothetical protein
MTKQVLDEHFPVMSDEDLGLGVSVKDIAKLSVRCWKNNSFARKTLTTWREAVSHGW